MNRTSNFIFMLRSVLLVGLLYVVDASCRIKPPYAGNSVVRLTFDDTKQRTAVLNELEEICEIRHLRDEYTDPQADFLELIVNFDQLRKVNRIMSSSSVRVLMGDLGSAIEHERESFIASPPAESGQVCADNTCSAAELKAGDVDIDFYKKYHTFEDFEERFRLLAATYSDYVKLESIGTTLEGRQIHMFRIGKTDKANPKRIVIDAMQHAREWITIMTVLYGVENLAVRAFNAKEWAYDIEVLVVPIVNPDGYVYSHTTDRMWRKNRNPRASCRGEPAGVDLNRNWGTDFGGDESTSTDPCSDIFTGPEAFSELETQALKKLFEETEGVKAHTDVHSFTQLVLGPWGHKDDTPPRVEEIDELGQLLNEKLSSGGKNYNFARGKNDYIYLASGVCPDWVFEAHNVLSYTFELRPKTMWEGGFMLPARNIIPNSKEYLASLDALLDYVQEKF